MCKCRMQYYWGVNKRSGTCARCDKKTQKVSSSFKTNQKKHLSFNICHWPQHQKHNYDTKLADLNFQCAKL